MLFAGQKGALKRWTLTRMFRSNCETSVKSSAGTWESQLQPIVSATLEGKYAQA